MGAMVTGTLSCEFDYKVALSNNTRNGKYIAEKTYNTKSGKTVIFTSATAQYLIFSGDTMKIVRNDTIIERLVNYDFVDWMQKKEGKAVFNGMSKEGSKSLLIEVVNIRHDSNTLILSPIMTAPYKENYDTLKTYYKDL